MNYQLMVTSILGLLTISTTISVVLLQRRTERLKIIEGQLSQSKYKAYGELVAIFYDLLKESKSKKKMEDNDVMARMINAKKDLFIYGSDTVFKKFVAWLIYASTNPGDNKHFKLFLSLLIEMRKDMGNPNTKLTPKDIMISLLQNEKEFEIIKEFIE